jgi:hypothetical protein
LNRRPDRPIVLAMNAKFLAMILVLSSSPALAADRAMTFFVTSRGGPAGANFGGLAGADRHCQKLAVAAGAGDRTWRAYLSAAPGAGRPAIHARDRIGPGPWVNAKGRLIARDLEELHSDANALDRHTALTEKASAVPGDEHDVLTGSDDQGRLAFSKAGVPATCANWTSAARGIARIGHADRLDASSWGNKRFPRWSGSWGSEHYTAGCGAKQLADTGGGGRLYCFAAGSPRAASAPPGRSGATFKRGLIVNHWLGDNLPPETLANSHYGAAWFDEEDVAWIAAQGFDHIRFRVSGGIWLTKRGDLDEKALAPFDRALAHARAHGLGVVLAMAGLPGFRSTVRGAPPPADAASPFTDEATRGDAAYLWWTVARRYAREGDALRFELLHSPNAPGPEPMLAFNQLCLRAVRRVSPTRVVYLTSHDMSLDAAVTVELPDPHTALAVDFWEPEVFSFQADQKRPAVEFPGRVPDLTAFGKEDEAARLFSNIEIDAALIDARLDAFAARAKRHAGAREIYVAGIGVYRRADDASARRYVRAVQSALERNRLAWALYDYHTGCAVRDEHGKPTRVLEALDLRRRVR